jgi:uncharacterized protein
MEKNQRRCVSCRKVGLKADFWRLVRLHQPKSQASTQASTGMFNQVVLDQGMGRSAYLCPCEDCLRAAQKKDRLSRALKTSIDPNLYEQLRQRLNQDLESS